MGEGWGLGTARLACGTCKNTYANESTLAKHKTSCKGVAAAAAGGEVRAAVPAHAPAVRPAAAMASAAALATDPQEP